MQQSQGELSVSADEFDLEKTLLGGQSFRWKKKDDGFYGVINDSVWILQRETNKVKFTVFYDKQKKFDPHVTLSDYFNLNVDLQALTETWKHSDARFAEVPTFHGVRILNIDPIECLFSFICSSNNNIKRITLMVDKLCKSFGNSIGSVNGNFYHAFPTIEQLAHPRVGETLRRLGFGYRAKFIANAARYLQAKNGRQWLNALVTLDYSDAHTELMSIPGVGPKVADCVLLLSLQKSDAVPIDIHMKTVASRLYNFETGNSLTLAKYRHLGNFFRSKWGKYAGWAQGTTGKRIRNCKANRHSCIKLKSSNSFIDN